MSLTSSIWNEERVPNKWRDALFVPIVKKGDLMKCDNWRGISLLNVMGKLLAMVIQSSLQKVLEEVLPD